MANSQQNPVPANTHLMAEQDAEADVKKIRWFFIGFFGNIVGVLIASIYNPMPPASRLLEKSPEDAALYTDSYRAKSRSVQTRQSLIGLIIPFILMFFWILLLGALM